MATVQTPEGIQLERVRNPFKFVRQLKAIRRLVQREADWLPEARPETWNAYSGRGPRGSVRTLRRLANAALNSDMGTYIGTRDGQAIMLASVSTKPQTVYHPVLERNYTGTHVDSWTAAGVQAEEHREALGALVKTDSVWRWVLATLAAPEIPHAPGIADWMLETGGPAQLESDYSGLADEHRPLQLYVSTVGELVR